MRVTKLFWFLSVLFVLIMLVMAYKMLPQHIITEVDANGAPMDSIEKTNFFYLMCGLALCFNMFVFILGRVVQLLPQRFIKVPSKAIWFRDAPTRTLFFKNIKAWFKGLGIIANLFCVELVNVVIRISEGVPYSSLMFYILPGLLIAWIAYFFYYFSAKAKSL